MILELTKNSHLCFEMKCSFIPKIAPFQTQTNMNMCENTKIHIYGSQINKWGINHIHTHLFYICYYMGHIVFSAFSYMYVV